MKCFKPSFFSFFKISGTHVLLKALAIWVVIIIFPCQVESTEFSTSQMSPELINGNLVCVEGVSKGFVGGNVAFVFENEQLWFKQVKEFFRSICLFFVSEEWVGKQSSQKDTENNMKDIVHHPIFYYFEGFFISVLIYWYLFFSKKSDD